MTRWESFHNLRRSKNVLAWQWNTVERFSRIVNKREQKSLCLQGYHWNINFPLVRLRGYLKRPFAVGFPLTPSLCCHQRLSYEKDFLTADKPITWRLPWNFAVDVGFWRSKCVVIKRYKPEPPYVVDHMAHQHGFVVIRLPPYHFVLSRMELICSWMKRYVADKNTTFKTADVKGLTARKHLQLCHRICGNQLVATAKTLSKLLGGRQYEVAELTIKIDGQEDDVEEE